jgi:ketosteroid isomerase-like protein
MNNELQISTLIENWAAAKRNRDIDAILDHHSADMVMYDVPDMGNRDIVLEIILEIFA